MSKKDQTRKYPKFFDGMDDPEMIDWEESSDSSDMPRENERQCLPFPAILIGAAAASCNPRCNPNFVGCNPRLCNPNCNPSCNPRFCNPNCNPGLACFPNCAPRLCRPNQVSCRPYQPIVCRPGRPTTLPAYFCRPRA